MKLVSQLSRSRWATRIFYNPLEAALNARQILKSVVVGGLATVVVTAAVAQGFGRAASKPWSGGVKVVDRLSTPLTDAARIGVARPSDTVPLLFPRPPRPQQRPSVRIDLGPVIAARWSAARPEIQSQIEGALKERAIGGGFRTSRNHVALAAGGPMFVGTDGTGFTVRYAVAGNTLATRLRVPSDISSSSTDPAFKVIFDLDIQIDIETRDGHLRAGPVKVRVDAHRPQGKNLTGDVAVALNNLVRFLGGPDFIDVVRSKIHAQSISFDTGVNGELRKLEPFLDRALGSRGELRPGYQAPTRDVVIDIVSAGTAH